MSIQDRRVETTTVDVVEPTAAADRTVATSYDPYAGRRQLALRLVQVVSLLFGVLETLIALRVILRALGANPNAGFAQFIYGLTAPFVAPFVGLFGTPQAGGSVLELHSIVALVVYALLAWLVVRLVWLVFGESRSAVRTTASSIETRS